jgi:nucleotide-binding universal stress UspA family protein
MKNKIFIAVDLSDQTTNIIEKGIELANKLEGTVLICSIIPLYVDYLQSQMALIPSQWDEIYSAQKEHSLKALNAFKTLYQDLTIDTYAEVGNPKMDIINKALEFNADYIVVGTHGRTGLSHTIMGSTAEYIVRHATVPVLVVPMNRALH